MNSVLNEFSLKGTDFSSVENAPQLAIVNEHFGMILGVGPYRDEFIKIGQPYRFIEGRILMMTEGTATCEVNLETYHLEKGDIVLLMPETIMELLECSEHDWYHIQGKSFRLNKHLIAQYQQGMARNT